MVPTDRDAGQAGCAGVGCDMKSSTVVAQEGVLLLGISLIITILGMHMFHRFRGKPINSSVAGLLIGIGTGALVSFFWLSVTRSSPHSSIQLDNKVCYPRCSMPCYNIICSIAWSSNRIVGTVLLHILATVIERLPTLSLSLRHISMQTMLQPHYFRKAMPSTIVVLCPCMSFELHSCKVECKLWTCQICTTHDHHTSMFASSHLRARQWGMGQHNECMVYVHACPQRFARRALSEARNTARMCTQRFSVQCNDCQPTNVVPI
jgi:hypothetical protein